MKESLPYYSKNILFMHIFAQYRPELHWPVVVKLVYYFWRGFIQFSFTATLIFSFADIIISGFDQIADVAMQCINLFIYSSIWIRGPYFMYRNDMVEYLIQRTNSVMKESGSFAFDKYTMKKGRKMSDRVLIIWLFFVLVCGVLMAMSSLFKEEKTLSLPMWLFYDWTKGWYFVITFILQTSAQIFMVCCFGNIEMFNICFHVILKHQFELLGEDFKFSIPNVLHKCGMPRSEVENYIDNPEDVTLWKKVYSLSRTTEFQNGVRENLKVCVIHHQNLMNYQDEFYKFISPLLVIEVNFLFGYMIFVLFSLVTTNNISLYVPLSQYLWAIVSQIFIIMLAGEILTNQIEELRGTLFNIPWYICDVNFLKDFILIQQRMTRLDYLKAGKLIPISLECWLEFMRKAASFFAVLRQVNDQ